MTADKPKHSSFFYPSRLVFLRDFFLLPVYVRLLLITQLCFNVGFYMVLPYLATHLRDHLALTGTAVGLVLGLRTFSQQGLFLVGGTLSDRFGPRTIILTGILIRIAGFLMLGISKALPGVIAGVVLIGFAAALFSPAVESSIAYAASEVEHDTRLPRTQIFAMGSVSLQFGAALGPLIGSLLLLVDYRFSCIVAAGIFGSVWLAYLTLFPNIEPKHKGESFLKGWNEVLCNRYFLLFAIANSTYLVAYNQLYLAVPTELTRSMGNDKLLGVLMATSSIMIIFGQVGLTSWVRKYLGWRRAIPIGFLIMALGFASIAGASLVPLFPKPWSAVPVIFMILLFTLGKMMASPFTTDFVVRLANERRLGAYYGFLNSFGGLAVLVGSTAIGSLLNTVEYGLKVARPWILIVFMMVSSAILISILMLRLKYKDNPSSAAQP